MSFFDHSPLLMAADEAVSPSSTLAAPKVQLLPANTQRKAQSSSVQPQTSWPREFLHLRRRELLAVQSGQLWEVEAGFVRSMTWDEQGMVAVLGVWGPGDRLALPLSGIQPCQFDCLRPAKLRCIARDQAYPCSFLEEQNRHLETLLCLSRIRALDLRVLRTLHWLAQRFGKRHGEAWHLGIPLTHQELADLVGSTRVTITRILQQLQRSGDVCCAAGGQWYVAVTATAFPLAPPSQPLLAFHNR